MIKKIESHLYNPFFYRSKLLYTPCAGTKLAREKGVGFVLPKFNPKLVAKLVPLDNASKFFLPPTWGLHKEKEVRSY